MFEIVARRLLIFVENILGDVHECFCVFVEGAVGEAFECFFQLDLRIIQERQFFGRIFSLFLKDSGHLSDIAL